MDKIKITSIEDAHFLISILDEKGIGAGFEKVGCYYEVTIF